MQFLKTILILIFATLISAAAFPQDVDTAIEASFTGIRTKQSADGRQYTFEIYGEGKLEGTIVVIDDPAAPELAINSFGTGGAQLNGTALDATDSSGLALACDRACKVEKFIRKYGLRALRFLACLRNRLPAPCWGGVFSCLATANPWVCLAAVACGAPTIKSCL